MPLPLAFPFIVKGIVLASKLLASKGAAVTAAKATTLAVKTAGLKATVATVTTGLIVMGGLQWTYERYVKGRSVVQSFNSGEHATAAKELVALVASFGSVGGSDFLEDAQNWIDEGMSVTSSQFAQVVSDLNGLLDEMKETGQTPIPI